MSNAKAEMDALLSALLDAVPSHYSVCSLQAPKDDCVTFLRSERYIESLHAMVAQEVKNVRVVAPINAALPTVSGISSYLTKHVDLLFTLFNNHVRKGGGPRKYGRISSSVILDQGAVIGANAFTMPVCATLRYRNGATSSHTAPTAMACGVSSHLPMFWPIRK